MTYDELKAELRRMTIKELVDRWEEAFGWYGYRVGYHDKVEMELYRRDPETTKRWYMATVATGHPATPREYFKAA